MYFLVCCIRTILHLWKFSSGCNRLAVFLHHSNFGKEKRELSKNTVLKFNETVKQHVSEEKLAHFMEVAEIINELILEKSIFTTPENESNENTMMMSENTKQ